MSNAYTEDHLIEQPAIQLMRHGLGWAGLGWAGLGWAGLGWAGLGWAGLGWEVASCYDEWNGGVSNQGRDGKREVVLVSRLRSALQWLNPDLPGDAVEGAMEEICRDRTALSLVEANREIDRLLKQAVKVTFPDPENGGPRVEMVRVVDWEVPENNDFLLGSQFWVAGELYLKRTDLIGFVNGLPLVLIELKKPGVNVREAFDKNLADYKETIPQLFHYNALLIVSNGVQSKVGSLTAEWEHFGDWKKVASEEDVPGISLETLLRGTCEKGRLLDLVENFSRFSESKGAVSKLVARNHQFLGVNRAIAALRSTLTPALSQGEREIKHYRGGFQVAGMLERARELRERQTPAEEVLSERDDIIVLTDEAHRSQYDTLAMNMRTALPNAKFVAFTGTPLITGEERTREVFGDYVSIYDFKQSVEDGATVPLFYENRTPELQITNPELNEEIYQTIEDAGLDDDQEEKLRNVLGQRYHLITRDDRLDAVAKDIVHHFLNRGYQGKAMVVSIDKLTTLRMYEKVRTEWEAEKARVSARLAGMSPQFPEYEELNARLGNLLETDMAVVVSPGQNEISEMAAKGIDIQPHRERMVKEDLDEKFKNPEDKFRLVFVCAMWLTGFDAPSCSTLYLDKPMRGHTLMQTIARATRVYGDKVNGLIVDYANVFQELEKALAIYGAGNSGGELPVKDKTELVAALKIALQQVTEFCRKQNVDLEAIPNSSNTLFIPAVNQLLRTDEVRESFLGQANDVARLYKAVMPDPVIPLLAPRAQVIAELAKAVRAQKDPVNITEVMTAISGVLDGAIVAEPHIEPGVTAKTIDLSKIDFEVLARKFENSKTKNIEAQKLRALIERKLDNLIRLNASRYDFLDRFQKMIEAYNSGALSIEQLFAELVSFTKELSEEEERHLRENVSEEELAVFDILTRPGPDLTPVEIEAIKKVCKDLLAKLKTEKLVLAWRTKRTTRAAVRVEIEKMLDSGLPEKYTTELFETKCGALFQHVLEKYPESGESVYEVAA